MQKTLFILGLLIFLIIGSCKNEENPISQPQPNYTDIDVVTGMDFFDDNGNPIGRWNSPNHNPGDVFTFPNPSIGTVSVYSQQKIVRIWLLPANCITDSITIDIPTLSQDLNYEIAELENLQIKDISIPAFNNQVSLDFSDVSKGFHKIFYQLETGALFWQNLFIDPTASNIPTFDELDGLCD